MKLKLCSIPALVLPSGVALAQGVVPVSSNRIVSVVNRETSPTTTQSFAGPNLGAWSAQAFASNDSGQPNYNPIGGLVAISSNQQSSFLSGGVTFSGFVFVDYTSASAPNLGVTGTNRCDAVFHVDNAIPFALQATLTFTGVVPGETSSVVSLTNNTSSQSLFSITSSDSRSGTLLAGDYTLSILIQGSASGLNQIGDSRRQVDMTFTVPAPASAALLALGGVSVARRRR